MRRSSPSTAHSAANVTPVEDRLAETKSSNTDISQNDVLARAVAVRRAELWLAENSDPLASSNAYVEASARALSRVLMSRFEVLRHARQRGMS
ncbi:MAG: type II toxin-antitoxin system CcdA family antitoxin [Aromatoleum sp.]|jgi:antitoxin CcdA|uniref:type II toxin-antitoxin system CcdA family antitoxin n=1 Tax=Aromatoleum sp. TaxID=2307007 RepID=UPI00289478C2|nr:type II toxin-antitoxin system CcdA family antitoxin [Aromatoleum sp.]MDT3669366.1 type II toxin-antitoxin system CcdA family antitoxin [Aromatoleum sp.]